jgi:hypothetical protein
VRKLACALKPFFWITCVLDRAFDEGEKLKII